MSENIFYVYAHRKKINNEIFYIGKGKNNRAFSASNRNKYWHNIVNMHGFTVEILKDNISETDAFNLEIEAIKRHRENGIKLANITDGGEGISGLSHSKESKIKMSLSAKGRVSPMKGKKLPILQIEKHSMFMKGNHFKSDNTIYRFENINGYCFNGTRFELRHDYGIPYCNIHEIIRGGVCLNGWALVGYDFSINRRSKSKIGANNYMYGKNGAMSHNSKKDILLLKKDNETFIGTWYEFADKFNINRKLSSAFFAGRKKSCYGWKIST